MTIIFNDLALSSNNYGYYKAIWKSLKLKSKKKKNHASFIKYETFFKMGRTAWHSNNFRSCICKNLYRRLVGLRGKQIEVINAF